MSQGRQGVTSWLNDPAVSGRRKRIFVQLAATAAALLSLLILTFVYLLLRYTGIMQVVLVFFLRVGVATFAVFAGLSLGIIVLLIWTGWSSGYWERIVRPFVVKWMLPLAVVVGRFIGISRDEVQGSFISVNNTLIEQRHAEFEAHDVLVLLPRCLQWSDCPYKVSQEVHRCQRCGQCSLGQLLGQTEHLGVPMFVSTGGTQARRLVEQRRPRLIIAVACERELTEGIRDVGGIPVLGVLNDQPEGPCYNTVVDSGCVAEVLKEIICEKGEDDTRVFV